MVIPELEHNPLVKRVVDTFDSNKSGEVDFIEFIQALTIFARASDKGEEDKFKFTFKLYDVDGDGFISNSDLFQILKAMVGANLNDQQLQQLVDRTIRQGDLDCDGKLSYDEFLAMTKAQGVADKLRLDMFAASKAAAAAAGAAGAGVPNNKP